MRSFRRKGFLLLLLGCGLLAASAAQAGKEAKDAGGTADAKAGSSKKDEKAKSGKADDSGDKPEADDSDAQSADAVDDAAGRVAIPLVQGHDSFGLKIPYFANGRRQMNYDIGVASRLDADRVKMKDLLVQTFNDSGEQEMTIEMPESVMNLTTHIIVSNTKAVITRPDMRITGDSVVFNTMTKKGQMVGDVHMTVYNIKAVAVPDQAQPAPAGAAKPHE